MCTSDPQELRRVGERCDFTMLSFRKHYPVPDGALLVAHSDRARARVAVLSHALSAESTSSVPDEVLRSKVLAKVKRYAWCSSARPVDDPQCNGLAESQASEALVDTATQTPQTDGRPGSIASAVFINQRSVSRDANAVGRRCREFVARLEAQVVPGLQVPLRDCRGFGVPLLVNDREVYRSLAAQRGLFLPTHWQMTDAARGCLVARTWHERELTVPVPAWSGDDDTRYLADTLVELWRSLRS